MYLHRKASNRSFFISFVVKHKKIRSIVMKEAEKYRKCGDQCKGRFVMYDFLFRGEMYPDTYKGVHEVEYRIEEREARKEVE